MTEHQLDLFADLDPEAAPLPPRPERVAKHRGSAAEMDDTALIAAIAEADLADSATLAAEAGRRGLVGAIPALAALCRRFTGFGADRIVPEQSAALDGLAEIGGADAAQVVSGLISHAVVQGPTLVAAVAVAARLAAPLPAHVIGGLLRHVDPVIRASACRCTRRSPETITLLAELLRDGDRAVSIAAACALGRLGRNEALPALKQLLRAGASKEIIDAAAAIADEECMVLLGRIARSTPDLAEAALEALETIDHPRADVIAAAARRAASQRP